MCLIDFEKVLRKIDIQYESNVVVNPFTQESCVLEPEAAILYEFIKAAEFQLNHFKAEELLPFLEENFLKAIEYFARRWPKEYMILLD